MNFTPEIQFGLADEHTATRTSVAETTKIMQAGPGISAQFRAAVQGGWERYESANDKETARLALESLREEMDAWAKEQTDDDTPDTPDTAPLFFAIIWRPACLDGWQPVTSPSQPDLASAIAYAAESVRGSAATCIGVETKPHPMPCVEIKSVRQHEGRIQVSYPESPAVINDRMRKVWLESIPADHPDRSAA